jgi:hypothetical protein
MLIFAGKVKENNKFRAFGGLFAKYFPPIHCFDGIWTFGGREGMDGFWMQKDVLVPLWFVGHLRENGGIYAQASPSNIVLTAFCKGMKILDANGGARAHYRPL